LVKAPPSISLPLGGPRRLSLSWFQRCGARTKVDRRVSLARVGPPDRGLGISIRGLCTTCQRWAYLDEGSEQVCPVCSLPLLLEGSAEPPAADPESGAQAPKSLGKPSGAEQRQSANRPDDREDLLSMRQAEASGCLLQAGRRRAGSARDVQGVFQGRAASRVGSRSEGSGTPAADPRAVADEGFAP
jgi:hypothetical protein